MQGKVGLCVLLALLATSCFCRPASNTHQPEKRQHSNWLGTLSQDQKHLISQFLPHLYAEELASKDGSWHGKDAAVHPHDYPNWMDFGRRSSEDSDDNM
uniref:Gastrin/cholecystokinin peptide hormone domain-containing protein n=1 Tax=Sphenodon punctatus TaxID=8508 RepID=A0A8D0HCR7_SPHPU